MATFKDVDISVSAATTATATLTLPDTGDYELVGVRLNIASKTGAAATAILRLGNVSGFAAGAASQFYESASVSLASLPINEDDGRSGTSTFFWPDSSKKVYALLTLNASDTVSASFSVFTVPFRG